jgi:hypothetical protein
MLVAGASPAHAVLVTFDGAAAGSPYGLGDAFTSEGVNFEVDAYNPGSGTTVTVGPNPFGTPPGSDPVAYPNNLNLDIDFIGSVGQQSYAAIQFTYNGGNVNFLVNGAQSDVPASGAGFFPFDGLVINGVSVSVVDLSGIGPGRGRIDLTGAIDRIVLGGQETLFDDIRTIPVPEPATLALAAIACLLVGAYPCRRFARRWFFGRSGARESGLGPRMTGRSDPSRKP